MLEKGDFGHTCSNGGKWIMKWTRIGGMATLVATVGLALALSLGLIGSWTASAQDTFIVNDNTTPAEDGCDTPDFETEDIQTAVDSGDVADGDILIICDGTYNPPNSIQVTKELVIEGRAAADRADIVIVGSGDGFVLASGVTIRHLTLEGAGADRGIYVTGDDNVIEDVEVSDWFNGIFLDGAEGNTVQDSDTHDNDNLGIIAQGGSQNTIQRNVSQANDRGIGLEDEDEALVADNVVSGNTLDQIFLDADSAIINVWVLRNQITSAPPSDGIFIDQIDTADSLIVIGGRPEDANDFSASTYDPVADSYYVELACESENTVDATYNFWGAGLARTDIANRIFNDEDDLGAECAAPDDVKGAVVFHPWATEPAPTVTPTATPTATGTPTPTATPGTRDIDLSPQGWHGLTWSGADATDPETALTCIEGDFEIAYMWVGTSQQWLRFVPDEPLLSNIAALDKYDSLLVLITAAGVTCTMPVVP